jgi:hypothetical protein
MFAAEATGLALANPYMGRGCHYGHGPRERCWSMIEEYTRYIGRADLLRDHIDGRVGL